MKECPTCGAKMVEYKHSLSRSLVQGLILLAQAGGGPINLKELDLTRNQWDNFQKMRYFDLVRQIGVKSGVWEITDNGWKFLTGKAKTYKSAWTYRGVMQRKDGAIVGIRDIVTLPPGYEKREDYVQNAVPHSPVV